MMLGRERNEWWWWDMSVKPKPAIEARLKRLHAVLGEFRWYSWNGISISEPISQE